MIRVAEPVTIVTKSTRKRVTLSPSTPKAQGRPKVYDTAAERQKAYRARKRELERGLQPKETT